MKWLRSIPLFGIILVVYNVLLLSNDPNAALIRPLFSIPLASGTAAAVAVRDLILVFAVIMLYLEMLKATRTGSATILDHGLSMAAFVVFLVEFIAVPGCGTATFLVLMLMSLVDVVAGFTISIVAARRDLAVGGDIGHTGA